MKNVYIPLITIFALFLVAVSCSSGGNNGNSLSDSLISADSIKIDTMIIADTLVIDTSITL